MGVSIGPEQPEDTQAFLELIAKGDTILHVVAARFVRLGWLESVVRGGSSGKYLVTPEGLAVLHAKGVRW